jgi:hypothetical protein
MTQIVCQACGLGPVDGTALFSTQGKRHCAEHLPIADARRRLDNKTGPTLDRDIIAIFQRRLAEAARPMAAE